MSGICFTETEYPCEAGRLISVRGGTTQMWGGLTQDYVGRIDRYSISNELFNVNHVKKHLHKHKKLFIKVFVRVHLSPPKCIMM